MKRAEKKQAHMISLRVDSVEHFIQYTKMHNGLLIRELRQFPSMSAAWTHGCFELINHIWNTVNPDNWHDRRDWPIRVIAQDPKIMELIDPDVQGLLKYFIEGSLRTFHCPRKKKVHHPILHQAMRNLGSDSDYGPSVGYITAALRQLIHLKSEWMTKAEADKAVCDVQRRRFPWIFNDELDFLK